MNETKSWEMKAEPMTTSQLDRWLAGKVPRRILVAPFGGSLGKAGLDLDGEHFDPDPCGAPGCRGSDFYGPYPALRKSRDRFVDFHHSTFLDRPRSAAEEAVKGAVMGHVVLDEEYAEEDAGFAGLWGSFWANAGEKRRSLMRWLEEHGTPLFGSSQPIQAGVIRGKAGHLCQWPIAFHTISTSPQNTYAVVPALKARLGDQLAELSPGALDAFLAAEGNLGRDLLPTSGEAGAKAGRVLSGVNEQDIDEALAALRAASEQLTRVIGRHRKENQ